MRAGRGGGPLLWLVCLPLAAIGTVAGHSLGYLVVSPNEDDRARLLHETGHGYLAHVPLFLGLCLALIAVALALRVSGRLRDRPAALPFALFAPLAFLAQEHAERLIAGGGLHGLALVEPPVLVGLLVQLPLALAAYLLARALVTLADVVADAISSPRRRATGSVAAAPAPTPEPLPRLPALAAGHAGRAPPRASAQ